MCIRDSYTISPITDHSKPLTRQNVLAKPRICLRTAEVRPGPGSPPDSTSPVNDTNPHTLDTATTGSPAHSVLPRWQPTAPRTPPSSAPATGAWPDA